MRKFIINYRRNPTVIMEVEVEKLNFMNDPWAPMRKSGEWIGRVISPNSIFDKDKITGKSIPYEAYWFMFFDSVETAQKYLFCSMLMSLMKEKYYKSLEGGEKLSHAEHDVMYGLISGSEDIDKVVANHKESLNKHISEIEVIML